MVHDSEHKEALPALKEFYASLAVITTVLTSQRYVRLSVNYKLNATNQTGLFQRSQIPVRDLVQYLTSMWLGAKMSARLLLGRSANRGSFITLLYQCRRFLQVSFGSEEGG